MKDPKRGWDPGRRGAGKDRKATGAWTNEALLRKVGCREGPESYSGRDGRGAGREGGMPGRTGRLQWPGPMRCCKERCRERTGKLQGPGQMRCWEGRRGVGKDWKATGAWTNEALQGKERCREGPESYSGRDGRGAGREEEMPGRTGKLQGPGQMRCW